MRLHVYLGNLPDAELQDPCYRPATIEEIRAVEERLTRERDEALAALAGCVRYQSMRTYLDKEPYHAAWTEAHRIVGPRPN